MNDYVTAEKDVLEQNQIKWAMTFITISDKSKSIMLLQKNKAQINILYIFIIFIVVYI